MRRFKVALTVEERELLEGLTSKGKIGVRKLKRAEILLKANEGLSDTKIALHTGTSRPTAERIRKQFVLEGLDAALDDKTRTRSRTPKLDGGGEAQLTVLACSTPPEGRSRWTLSLLAGKLIELKVVNTISGEAVREHLKKMNLSLG